MKKNIYNILTALILCLPSMVFAQDFNTMQEISVNGTTVTVDIKVDMLTTNDILPTNLGINYPTEKLSSPVLKYSMYDIDPTNFNAPNVTTGTGYVLANVNPATGSPYTAPDGYQKLASIEFTLVDPNTPISATEISFRNTTEGTGNSIVLNSSFQQLNNGQSQSNLPVELVNFSVEKSSPRSTVLDWSTAMERNAEKYEIERAIGSNKFRTIGQVAAVGNSTELSDYSYEDVDIPLHGAENYVYYRLKMIDFDGSFEYSRTEQVLFANNSDILTVFPNPTADQINIDLQEELEQVRVYNNQGVVVQEERTNTFSIKELPTGMYKIEIKTQTNTYLRSVVKIN